MQWPAKWSSTPSPAALRASEAEAAASVCRPADDRITTMAGEVEAIEDTFADIVAAPADDPGRDSKLKMCARHLRELV